MVSTPVCRATLFCSYPPPARRSCWGSLRSRALAALAVLAGLLADQPLAQADKALGLGVEAGITTPDINFALQPCHPCSGRRHPAKL